MKVNMSYVFKSLEGKPQREMTLEKDKKGNPKLDDQGRTIPTLGKPFTLRGACLNVLTNPPVDIDLRSGREKEVSAEEKLKWAELAQRIYKCNGLLDISADEVVLLKNFINKRYRNPLTVAQAFKILDPKNKD